MVTSTKEAVDLCLTKELVSYHAFLREVTLLKECLQGVPMQLNTLIYFPDKSEGE